MDVLWCSSAPERDHKAAGSASESGWLLSCGSAMALAALPLEEPWQGLRLLLRVTGRLHPCEVRSGEGAACNLGHPESTCFPRLSRRWLLLVAAQAAVTLSAVTTFKHVLFVLVGVLVGRRPWRAARSTRSPTTLAASAARVASLCGGGRPVRPEPVGRCGREVESAPPSLRLGRREPPPGGINAPLGPFRLLGSPHSTGGMYAPRAGG